MPLKSEDEVLPAVRYLAKYDIECQFYTDLNKIESFYQAQDSTCDLLMASRGGFDSVELLSQIDFSRVKKQLCGYSDITVLLNALLSQSGKVQYLGPNLKAFNQDIDEYTIHNFIKTVWPQNEVVYSAALKYIDPHVSKDTMFSNDGNIVVNEGTAEGYLVGGNLCSQAMLWGTKYFPIYDHMLLVAEEDDLCREYTVNMFLRNLCSLFEYDFAQNIKGLIIGRFMNNSLVDMPYFIQKLRSFDRLRKIPVIANFDTGHTLPQMTLPLGKKAVLDTKALYKLKF